MLAEYRDADRTEAFIRRTSWTLLVLLVCLLSGLVPAAHSQGGPWKIGVLWEVQETPPRFVPLVQWLRDDLKAQGFSDKELQFEVRQVEGTAGLPEATRDLLRAHVHLIWTSSDVPARFAKAETRDTPIVFGVSADPVKTGAVQQLASPGGNVTGVAIHAHVIGKRLELLKAMIPHARRILVTPDPDLEDTKAWLDEVRDASRRLNVTIVERPVTSKTDLERWPETFRTERIDAVLHLVNATVNANWEVALKALQSARALISCEAACGALK
jgi:ABC-type uncharacterized transport system substrate-binding protein